MARDGDMFVVSVLQLLPSRHALHKQNLISLSLS